MTFTHLFLPNFSHNALLACLISLLLLSFTHPTPAQFSTTPNPNTWMTDREVNDMVYNGETLFLAGDFAYVGPPTGGGVPVDMETGKPWENFDRVQGHVNACASDGNGGWFIGGDFTMVGNLERKSLAHINADGSVDENWNQSVDYIINTIAVSETIVYIGGYFFEVGNVKQSHLAALDKTTGNLLAWDPKPDASILNIQIDADSIYICGGFKTIGGKARNWLAELDRLTGISTDWNPNPNYVVYELVVMDELVYAGGRFTQIGGENRNLLAAINKETGFATDWNPNINNGSYVGNSIQALAIKDSIIYVGGSFTHIGDIQRYNLGAVDLVTGLATDWNPEADDWVWDIAIHDSTVYVGGYRFFEFGGELRSGVAAIDIDTGLETDWNPGTNRGVSAISISGSTIYLGGWFSSVGGVKRNQLVAIDATTGAPTEWAPFNTPEDWRLRTLGVVNRLGLFDSFLAVFGGFTFWQDDFPYWRNLWFYNGNSAEWLDLAPKIGHIEIFSINGSDLYYTDRRKSISVWNIDTRNQKSWELNPNGMITTMEVEGGLIYLGGKFTQIGGKSRNYLAAFDPVAGIITDWNPNADGPIDELSVFGDALFVAGEFEHIGSEPRLSAAKIDMRTGLPHSWKLPLEFDANYITALQSGVYVGGTMDSNSFYQYNLMALDHESGKRKGWNVILTFEWSRDPISSIIETENSLYVAGDIMRVNGVLWGNFAQFDRIPDTTPPISSASASELTQFTSPIAGTYTADDGLEGSGVDIVELYALEPGGAWANAGVVTGGTFSYVPSRSGEDANGIYHFATVATDLAGNREPSPLELMLGDVSIVGDVHIEFIDSSETTGSGIAAVEDWMILE